MLKKYSQLSENVDSFGIPFLMEMANAIQKYTGLPGVIYFSTKEEVKNKQSHSLGRIKWRHAGKSAFISILKDPKDHKRKAGGEPNLIPKLEEFVEKNETVLWEYWNTPADEADSAETLKKFIKIN